MMLRHLLTSICMHSAAPGPAPSTTAAKESNDAHARDHTVAPFEHSERGSCLVNTRGWSRPAMNLCLSLRMMVVRCWSFGPVTTVLKNSHPGSSKRPSTTTVLRYASSKKEIGRAHV